MQPDDFKPMKSIGAGVEEIRIKESGNAYRIVYIARFGDAVHVLHAFQKKSQKTSKRDLEIATQRYKQVVTERRS